MNSPNMDSPKLNGHTPTLLACFLQFDLSFMLWVMLGALGIFVAESLHLTPAQKGLLVAIPILSGSLLRVPMGLLSDRLGGKVVGAGILCFLFLPLALDGFGLSLANNKNATSTIASGIMASTKTLCQP